MGKGKKTISLVIIIIGVIIINGACSPIRRHSRLVKRYPFVHNRYGCFKGYY